MKGWVAESNSIRRIFPWLFYPISGYICINVIVISVGKPTLVESGVKVKVSASSSI